MALRSVLIFIFAFVFQAFSYDYGVTCHGFIDPLKLKKNSKFDFNSIVLFPSGLSYFAISPRMCMHLSDKVDFSIGAGFRRPFPNQNFVAGIHTFLDSTIDKNIFLFQKGISFEYLKWPYEIRINYYMPFRKCDPTKKHIEVDIYKKFDQFDIAIASNFDFQVKKISLKPRVYVPIFSCILESGVNIHENFKKSYPYIGVLIPFFSKGEKCVSRDSNVKISKKFLRCYQKAHRKKIFIPSANKKLEVCKENPKKEAPEILTNEEINRRAEMDGKFLIEEGPDEVIINCEDYRGVITIKDPPDQPKEENSSHWLYRWFGPPDLSSSVEKQELKGSND